MKPKTNKKVNSTKSVRKRKYISLIDIDLMELHKMFHEFDKAMEHRQDHPSITHPQIRLVK